MEIWIKNWLWYYQHVNDGFSSYIEYIMAFPIFAAAVVLGLISCINDMINFWFTIQILFFGIPKEEYTIHINWLEFLEARFER